MFLLKIINFDIQKMRQRIALPQLYATMYTTFTEILLCNWLLCCGDLLQSSVYFIYLWQFYLGVSQSSIAGENDDDDDLSYLSFNSQSTPIGAAEAPSRYSQDGSPGAPSRDGSPGAPSRDGSPGAPGFDGQPGAPGRANFDGLDGQPASPGRDGPFGFERQPATAAELPGPPVSQSRGLRRWNVQGMYIMKLIVKGHNYQLCWITYKHDHSLRYEVQSECN